MKFKTSSNMNKHKRNIHEKQRQHMVNTRQNTVFQPWPIKVRCVKLRIKFARSYSTAFCWIRLICFLVGWKRRFFVVRWKKTLSCRNCALLIYFNFLFNLQCDICSQSFFSRESLRKHHYRHINAKRLKCPKDGCSYMYLWYNGLKKHFHRQHPNDNNIIPSEKQFYDDLSLLNS